MDTKLTGRDAMADSTQPQTALSQAANERSSLRRCRTREEGLALVAVSHAIEYLIDLRLSRQPGPSGQAEREALTMEREALTILMQANRSIYDNGIAVDRAPTLVPRLAQFRGWIRRSLARSG